MAAKIEQPSVGLEKLFKRAKRFYHSQLRNNDGYLSTETNQNVDGASKQAQKAPGELRASAVSKSSDESDRISSSGPYLQANSTLNKLRDSTTGSKSKDVNDILTPEAARPEIRSVNGTPFEVRNSTNLSDYPRPELSNTLNTDKLTEIINNSIKAAVQNLASDTNPACWRQEKEENIAKIESMCYNGYPQRLKSSQNKENVTSFTQYSQQVVSCAGRPMLSSNICSISAKNGSSGRNSKRSYNSHQLRSFPRQSPTCCIPSSKTDTISSVTCHQSVSKYKLIDCPYTKKEPDKPSKPSKPSKTSKTRKPCRHSKTDNRKMTGNVNIYICSEGNDGATNKKKTESNCDSMTTTNASCACSSSEVCASQSTASAKTIRNLMETRNKPDDITLKCLCGKLPSDCECFPVESNINEGEELCLCDISSVNPTSSNVTCRDPLDYNLHTSINSESSPHGDYSTRRVRSRSSSQREPCCTRANCDTYTGGVELENRPEIYTDKSKLSTGNSGRGDAVQECCCCETFSNYSDGKCDACSCCNVNKVVADPSPRNQRERYPLQNNVQYSRRMDDLCNCCACDNDSLHSSSRKSDVPPTCCQKTNANKQAQDRLPRKDYCTKPCNTGKRTVDGSNDQQRSRYSDFCIMEEDEPCDASSCKPASATEQETSSRMNSFRKNSTKLRQESDAYQDRPDSKEQRSMSINDSIKRDERKIVVDDGVQTSQTITCSMKMLVAEVVKSNSNADKSTSSNYISFNSPVPSSLPASKSKSVVQTKTSPVKEPRKSSLKWPFSMTKSLISGNNQSAESKKHKSSVNVTSAVRKPEVDTASTLPVTNTSASIGSVGKISENVIKKSTNGITSASKSKNATVENSSSASKESAKENSLIVIKSSDTGGNRSKESTNENNTNLSSSKLGTSTPDKKNSVKSATNNETPQSYTDNTASNHCFCGAKDADMCTCEYPQCPRCARPQEDCKCNDQKDRSQEPPCNRCKQAKRLCCCCNASNQKKSYTVRSVPENSGFRVCTLCCRPEKNCCCNSTSQTSRRTRSPSIMGNKSADSYKLVGRKSQICLYCEEPRENCCCRAPIKKCSYCGMPSDVCNCQEVTSATCDTCSYDQNICQCNGRLVKNSDVDGQTMCVTAWKPRRDLRKYFSRNPGERDKPDCSCCDATRPYGSDGLPYQRLSVFSDVMTELQQKMSELTCCNRCGKTPCCCYVQDSGSYSRLV